MRSTLAIILALALPLAGTALLGCGGNPDEGPVVQDEQELQLEPGLHPAWAQAEEGEVLSYTAVNARGEETVYRYRMIDGTPQPLGDAPPLPADPGELGAIPVALDGEQPGDTRIDAAAGGHEVPHRVPIDWDPQAVQIEVPALEVDTGVRVRSADLAAQLEQQGRALVREPVAETGPTRAAEVERLHLGGDAVAEVYQFDSPVALEAWYRLSYQLHSSLGQAPEEHIFVEGMTMLRVNEHVDPAVPQTFRQAPKTAITR